MQLYNHPQTPFVSGFIGSPKINLIEGAVVEKSEARMLGVRLEHIDVSPETGEWRGHFRHVEHLGSDTVAYVDADQIGRMTVRIPGEVALRTVENIFMTPQKGNVYLFGADGGVRRV